MKAGSGSYALGIVGNASDGISLSVVGCTFASNRIEHADVAGVTPVCSRALIISAPSSSVNTDMGVANCTFEGPVVDGLYDIVQYGSNHRYPLNVINSIFTGAGMKAPHPFYVSAPEQFFVRDCTIENFYAPGKGLDIAGLECEAVPYVWEDAVTISHVPVLVPAARTPGLRETADVATNNVSVCCADFRFRLRGETAWRPLVPLQGGAAAIEALPIADANGNPRPFGSYTRGAVQNGTPAAETGATLLLRCEPYYGGSLSTPSTQMVEPGHPIEPVTATAAEGREFLGWYTTDDILYSKAEKLEISALNDDLVLIAKFSTPQASITFDLGDAGHFKDGGRSVITVSAGVGDVFPDVPPYDEAEGWHIYGWEDFPATVPAVSGTYHAQYVTKALRVIHVVPEEEVPEGSDGSGDSWENAMSDLGAAYRNAGLYRGEVWVKEGVYRLQASMQGLPNVSIFGGFTGTESSVSEADPKNHPTIITGDMRGDDYWTRSPGSLPIWDGNVFTEPHPTNIDSYWEPRGNTSDDTGLFLVTADKPLTNAVLQGLTITCFGSGAIHLISGTPDVVVRNCRFLANFTTASTGDFAVLFIKTGETVFEDCEFIGNMHVGVFAWQDENAWCVFRRCLFKENVSGGHGVCLRSQSNANLLVDSCDFIRNRGYGEGWGNPAVLNHAATKGTSILKNCLMEENHARSGTQGLINIGGEGRVKVLGCRFVKNDNKATAKQNNCFACIGNNCNGKIPEVSNCYFASNRVEIGSKVVGGWYASVAGFGYNNPMEFLNCTFVENVVDNQSSSSETQAGTFIVSSSGSLVNCLIDDSQLTNNAVEFCLTADKQRTFTLLNTAVRNEAAGYQPFRRTWEPFEMTLSHCAISGLNTNGFVTGENGYLCNLASNPGNFARLKEGPDGCPAMGISSASPYARAGLPVWRADDGYLYFYDDVAFPDAPWCRVELKGKFIDVPPAGVTLETPPIADAFGAPRSARHVAYGPLNVAPGGTILFLR